MPEVAYEAKSVKTKIAAIQTPSETQTTDTTAQTVASGQGGKKGKKKTLSKAK